MHGRPGDRKGQEIAGAAAGVHGQERAGSNPATRPTRAGPPLRDAPAAVTPGRVSGPRRSGRARAADGGPAHRVHRQDRQNAIPDFWRFRLDGRVCRSQAADAAIVKCCRASSFSPVRFWQPPRTGRNDERLASGLVSRRTAAPAPRGRPGAAGPARRRVTSPTGTPRAAVRRPIRRPAGLPSRRAIRLPGGADRTLRRGTCRQSGAGGGGRSGSPRSSRPSSCWPSSRPSACTSTSTPS